MGHLPKDKAQVGKPRPRTALSSRVADVRFQPVSVRGQIDRLKTAGCMGGPSFSGGGGGYGGGGMGGGTRSSSGGNFYSPELSTDFLELPQSQFELWQYFRFFYANDPFVGQAVDQHTEIPMSKLRISLPKARNQELAKKAKRFCEKWSERVRLYSKLMSICHDFNLLGEANILVDDKTPEMPEDIRFKQEMRLESDGSLTKTLVEREDADERAVKWLNKNYKGWHKIHVLPPENVHSDKVLFADTPLVQFIPDDKLRNMVELSQQGDPMSSVFIEQLPTVVLSGLTTNSPIYLNTDPYAGESFFVQISNNRSDYETRGRSILQRSSGKVSRNSMYVRRKTAKTILRLCMGDNSKYFFDKI